MKRKPKPKPKPKPRAVFVDKSALSIIGAADAEDGRFCISRLHVEPDGTTVATDGMRIIYVDPVPYDAGDWPSEIGGRPVKASGAVNVPKKVAADITKSIPRDSYTQRVTVAALTRDEGTVEFSATDLQQVKRTGYVMHEDDLPFPEWREMVEPPGEPILTIHMDAKKLAGTLAMLGQLSSSDETPVKLTFYGTEQPVYMEVTVKGDRKARAVQAPVRVQEPEGTAR